MVGEIGGGKIHLTCPAHHYVAGKLPPQTKGCPNCWKAYYWFDYATTPPHMRYERLQELESVIHHVVEFAEKGKFDFEPETNPTRRIYKDAVDDETGQEKIIIPGEDIN